MVECTGWAKNIHNQKSLQTQNQYSSFHRLRNLAAHIRQYKEILKKYNNVSDFSKVPLQVSFDATAVTERFQSRKLQSRCSDNVNRIIYGVATPSGPLQKTLINVETCEGRKHVAQDKSCICINGMENTLDLVEEGAISRAKSYMSIVLLALIPDSRPYCVGMYSVTKGTDSFALSTAHREVVNAVKEAGLVCMYVCMSTEGSARPAVVPPTYF